MKNLKSFFVIVLLIFTNSLFAQSGKINFIKGNIIEKTAAVREASGEEAEWLSNQAITFALDSKDILGNDRDLQGLVVAAIFSISSDNVKIKTDGEREILLNQLMQLFEKFQNCSTVQISVISKALQLKDDININAFTEMLNNYIKNLSVDSDSSVVKSALSALQYIGTEESFVDIYNVWNNPQFAKYNNEIEDTLNALIPLSMNEVLQIIQDKNFNQLVKIFKLIDKNKNISKNSLCEIAENVLNESILLIDDSSINKTELVDVQLKSLKILNENVWTPASSIALTYFGVAKKEYEQNILLAEDFTFVIGSLLNVAPLYAVTPLSTYLEELNKQQENNQEVSEDVVLAVISTLGAIGDKSAFDSLLAVTYLTYPENVLAAARNALSGLKW